jgi:hypothetical protein
MGYNEPEGKWLVSESLGYVKPYSEGDEASSIADDAMIVTIGEDQRVRVQFVKSGNKERWECDFATRLIELIRKEIAPPPTDCEFDVCKKTKPRRINVGDVWAAVYFNLDTEERKTGYSMKILHRQRYWCKNTKSMRTTWLALKLHLETYPGADCTQTYWFDDHGVCESEELDYMFELTRKRKA